MLLKIMKSKLALVIYACFVLLIISSYVIRDNISIKVIDKNGIFIYKTDEMDWIAMILKKYDQNIINKYWISRFFLENMQQLYSDGFKPLLIDGQYGFYDDDGNLVLSNSEWSRIGNFSDGLAPVSIVLPNSKRKWGYINDSGDWIIEPQFDGAFEFSEGLAKIYQNGLYGYIESTGEYFIQPKYKYATNFSDGLAGVEMRDEEDMYLVGYINSRKSFVIPLDGNRFRNLGLFSCNLAPVTYFSDDGKTNVVYIDKNGHIKIETHFEFGREFSEGLAAVSLGGKWGYINTLGEIVVKPQFSFASQYKNGKAYVSYW